jgi:hypothetical protein
MTCNLSHPSSSIVTVLDMCEDMKVKLAPPCEKKEKAFFSSSKRKVLGTFFNRDDLTWKSPDSKRFRYLNVANEVLGSPVVYLEMMQKLMGCLNHAGQLAPFMSGFKFSLNKMLGSLQVEGRKNSVLSKDARKELVIWVNFLQDEGWHPLCGHYQGTPLACKEFISDAAGTRVIEDSESRLGCGNVGFNHRGEIIFAYQLWWPEGILGTAVYKYGKTLGSKSTTLEFLGIMLPFLLIPESLCNQHIIVRVDNSACYFGWINKHSANDEMASILIRALHLIGAYMGSMIHIRHLPRILN